MYNFFGFLTLILIILTFISLILALFKPKLLMKKFNEKYHARKYAFILTLSLFILIILSAIGLSSTTPPEIKAKIQQQQEEQKISDQKKILEDKETALKESQQREKEKETAEAQKVYDDQKAYEEWVPKELERIANETSGDKLQSIQINKNLGNDPGNYIIVIQTKTGDGLTNNQAVKATWHTDIDLFKNLFNSGINITSIKIVSNSTLIDAYGKKEEAPVMMATMSQATANKMVWENFIISNFPHITENYWIHPALLK